MVGNAAFTRVTNVRQKIPCGRSKSMRLATLLVTAALMVAAVAGEMYPLT
jgi:hypothetical protein